MNLRESLQKQLEKAFKDYEKIKEIEELIRNHSKINQQIRDKNMKAIAKLDKGEIPSDAEQDEIFELGKQQEEVFRKLSDKIQNK
jgi:hypothetical protein